MNHEHMDETFRELQHELSLVPSPEFAAKVRARVADQPARRWVAAWLLSTLGAGAAVAAGVLLFTNTGRVTTVPEIAAVETRAELPPVPAPVVPSRSQVQVAPRPTAPRVHATSVPVEDPMPARPEPEVLVPPDQGIAVAAYMAQLRAGRVVIPAASSAPVTSETALVGVTPKPIELIEIPPIVVDLLPGTKAMLGGGSREQ